jgi:hypothetical protein
VSSLGTHLKIDFALPNVDSVPRYNLSRLFMDRKDEDFFNPLVARTF